MFVVEKSLIRIRFPDIYHDTVCPSQPLKRILLTHSDTFRTLVAMISNQDGKWNDVDKRKQIGMFRVMNRDSFPDRDMERMMRIAHWYLGCKLDQSL